MAARIMLDAVTITREPPLESEVLDEASGELSAEDGPVVYKGPCYIGQGFPGESTEGEALVGLTRYSAKLPHDAAVQDGDRAVVTVAVDPRMLGRVLTLRQPAGGTLTVVRDVVFEEVTVGADRAWE